jgi:hypothetical protein
MDAGGTMGRARAARSRRACPGALVTLALTVVLVFVGCSGAGSPAPGPVDAHGATLPTAAPSGTPGTPGTVTAFDPSVGAPLPYNRIVAAYGIVGGFDVNGPASTLNMLDAFLPQLQQLGQQYAALDPLHPVKLAIDLVVNVIQPCSAFPRYCSSWPDDPTMQAYVDYCQKHNLLLFFDVQLGTEPVKDAVMNHLLTYLEKYPFTELALDTEFHFPDNPQGYADAAGYPCCLGWMNADEINWASAELAQISLQQQLPRKVLLVHEWNSGVLPDKNKIQLNPDTSFVLQSDGFGNYGNKLGDYQLFDQQQLVEYAGYKLFFHYAAGGSFDYADYNNPAVQTPAQILQIFPQPLFISYQ